MSKAAATVATARDGGALARLARWLDQPKVLAWLMLGPAVLYVVAFVGFPFVLAIALSLSDATIGDPSLDNFVGLSNYATVIQTDAFQLALRNSLIVTAGVICLILVLATLASELLVYSFRGKRLFQTLFILPWAMPVSLAAIVWLWFLDSTFSPVDWILVELGVLGPGSPLGPYSHMYYLGREWLGLASTIVADVWRMLPLATIIVLAGRLSIPEERFEQARIDGAGVFRILFRITIPALKPMLIVAILFTSLLVIGEMSMIEILTRGGPGHSTQVLPYWAYLKGIAGGSLAQGAAIALFLFPFLLVVSVLALRAAYRAQEA
ncbi:multiple sugar transport system permease protein [Modicisalibacter muralis]|uniref:Multiple sugar transport system permease protein n=1 Tax=Modicisalibacter muralis TaxID=119000 RepID=A0A1G9KEG5_9GAMM|nr:sugar ABC transporter permease [Halomonas muralis]SDL47733.1 multiple sugar transport system permease protein [Halomonas muralis]